MRPGELLIVSKDDSIYYYDIRNKEKFHRRIKLEPGYYLVIVIHEKLFYEVVKDNKRILVVVI